MIAVYVLSIGTSLTILLCSIVCATTLRSASAIDLILA